MGRCGVVVGRCGSLWIVVGRCGSFHVLVTTDCAMGSPVSPIVANVCMEAIEELANSQLHR